MLRSEKQSEALIRNNGVVRRVSPGDVLYRDGKWRQFVFSTYHRRLSGLIALIEEVVFGKLDLRLAEVLLDRQKKRGVTLRTTHQELAEELGSSREVVSRLLKDWERHGFVELHRGQITILDLQGLEKIAK
jgi:CRP/FNR family transcriptional regulator